LHNEKDKLEGWARRMRNAAYSTNDEVQRVGQFARLSAILPSDENSITYLNIYV
jgi:hypothetical protein